MLLVAAYAPLDGSSGACPFWFGDQVVLRPAHITHICAKSLPCIAADTTTTRTLHAAAKRKQPVLRRVRATGFGSNFTGSSGGGSRDLLGDMPLEVVREKMWATLPDWLYMTIIDRSILDHLADLNETRAKQGKAAIIPEALHELSADEKEWMQRCVRWDCEEFVTGILKRGWDGIGHAPAEEPEAARARRARSPDAFEHVDVAGLAADGASADDIAEALRDWQVANARPRVSEAKLRRRASQSPALANVYYHERDLYFALTLARSATVHGRELVVGVVGASHLRGVLYALQHLPPRAGSRGASKDKDKPRRPAQPDD